MAKTSATKIDNADFQVNVHLNLTTTLNKFS